ncbi:MAG TPA: AAA family ATPase, partial [Longimicrobiaceae bacterium]|nr:AAA family ATPase [Longimicrobiaceae bacterium]
QREPPLLSRYLKVDERVVDFLVGVEAMDGALLHVVRPVASAPRLADLLLPDELARRLPLLAAERGPGGEPPVFHLQGPYGVGKESTAAALCREMGLGLLAVDVARLAADEPRAVADALRLAGREALLRGAALLLEGWDALLGDERRAARTAAVGEMEEWRAPTFVAGEAAWDPADSLHGRPFFRVTIPAPEYGDRVRLWRASLNGDASKGGGVDVEALANAFRFTGGQIRDAAATARNLALARDPGAARVGMDDLYAASRMHSNPRLGTLARKIEPRHRWDDIVLPAERVQQLREVIHHVRYRSLVFQEWGFDGKLAMGKGLNALFAGPSGTGKTMAAGIVAGELGLELYKVDLSTVVSKYIGETEKNLGRIFAEAETSNAVLFFDEADALFGRRSEVRDSHDRYANLETAYLLQRMEEFEGIVILATNFRKNMDDAFVRRIQFTVDFPFPGERERLRIWQAIWPEKAPRSADLDLEVVARRVEVAGGSIRNIALAAAFLAADDGGVVTMAHVVRATRREYQKMGKVLSEADLGHFAQHG